MNIYAMRNIKENFLSQRKENETLCHESEQLKPYGWLFHEENNWKVNENFILRGK